jgi:hypothetical protein
MPDIPTLKAEDEYRVIAYLRATNYETLCAYAAMKNGDPEYVLNAVIEYMLATQREFIAWRRQNDQSFLPADARPVQRAKMTAIRPRRRSRRPELSPSPGATSGNGRAVVDGEH